MNVLNKIEQFIFYFLIFAIPFQTRKLLWQQNWYFNEYQAIFIYGTDILMLVLFAFWLFRRPKLRVDRYDYLLLAFVVVSAFSIKNSSSHILSVWNVLKLIEFVLFYFYIKSYAVYKFGFSRSLFALIAGGVFQSVVAILQFWKQSSLGLRYFGESPLGPDLSGIASFYDFYGRKVIRAYGTTPHPNILAAYLFLAIFAFYFTYLYYHIYHRKEVYHPKLNIFLLASYPLMLLALFYTFARVMIFAWLAGFTIRACVVLGKKKFRDIFAHGINRVKLTKILVISTVVVVLFGAIYWPQAISRGRVSSGEEAVQLRLFYNRESLKALNWFGVGSGNFVNWLMVKDPNLARYFYQPVHNIYILIYSENGILGVALFILFLVFLVKDFINDSKMSKFYHFSFLILFLSILFVGLFDHFLWTLQEGRLMFWLLCSLLTFNKINDIN